MEAAVPPLYAMIVVVWAVVFLQFWRRRNAGLLSRYSPLPFKYLMILSSYQFPKIHVSVKLSSEIVSGTLVLYVN
jgi:hypothetical protein